MFTKHPYTVELVRKACIKIVADSPEQAQRIGKALSCGVSETATMWANEAMCSGDDSLGEVAQGEKGFCVQSLDEETCAKILSEMEE